MTVVAQPMSMATLAAQLSTMVDLKRVRVCDAKDDAELDRVPADGVLIAVVSDWTPDEFGRFCRRAVAGGHTVLPLRQDGAVTVLGPLIGPDLPGCLDCAEDARLRILSLPTDPANVTFGGPVPPANLPAVAAAAASIISDPAAAGLMWTFNAGNGTVSANTPAPRLGCRTCDRRCADTPDTARITLAARPLRDVGAWRQDNPATAGDKLAGELLHGQVGEVVRVGHNDQRPLPMASALYAADGRLDYGYGRGVTVEEARRTALFEAVERQLGLRPTARRTSLYASYADLGPDRALDPVSLGLPDPRYAEHRPALRRTPYRPDLATQWVYGWSLTRDTAVAVPEHVAYYGVAATDDAPHFLYETSNGCGLGNSVEEAALYGLFEVAERDAFLMAWYAATPLRRVAVPADDTQTWHIADALDEVGYDLMLFDATNDLGIPAVVSLALRRDMDATAPNAYFAAGAHPDPRIALRSAAAEVGVGLFANASMQHETATRDRERSLRMLADPMEVSQMEDHVLVYTLPEARCRYEFLLGGQAPADWRELWPDLPTPAADLTDVLTGLVDRLAGLGLETIVVDQTDPALRERLGLYAAKAIVPGTLPMTFGHVNHRTLGLPRLLEVPARLGRVPAVRQHADLPLHPHPFP